MSIRHFFEPLMDSSTLGLDAVVSGLRTSREITNKIRHRGHIRELPSREALDLKSCKVYRQPCSRRTTGAPI